MSDQDKEQTLALLIAAVVGLVIVVLGLVGVIHP